MGKAHSLFPWSNTVRTIILKKYTGKASGMQLRNKKVLVGKVNVRLIYSSTDDLFDDVLCS
jgi:hypothetical protein